VTAAEIIRVLERIGFVQVRQSGSHRIFKNEMGQRVTVPFHSGKILHPKVLKSILRDADLAVDDLLDLMGKRR
jgi:predicted RNA binding protein YcfA (HicA-like mRNA interferase family)